jgi:hypothetical protein
MSASLLSTHTQEQQQDRHRHAGNQKLQVEAQTPHQNNSGGKKTLTIYRHRWVKSLPAARRFNRCFLQLVRSLRRFAYVSENGLEKDYRNAIARIPRFGVSAGRCGAARAERDGCERHVGWRWDSRRRRGSDFPAPGRAIASRTARLLHFLPRTSNLVMPLTLDDCRPQLNAEPRRECNHAGNGDYQKNRFALMRTQDRSRPGSE